MHLWLLSSHHFDGPAIHIFNFNWCSLRNGFHENTRGATSTYVAVDFATTGKTSLVLLAKQVFQKSCCCCLKQCSLLSVGASNDSAFAAFTKLCFDKRSSDTGNYLGNLLMLPHQMLLLLLVMMLSAGTLFTLLSSVIVRYFHYLHLANLHMRTALANFRKVALLYCNGLYTQKPNWFKLWHLGRKAWATILLHRAWGLYTCIKNLLLQIIFMGKTGINSYKARTQSISNFIEIIQLVSCF